MPYNTFAAQLNTRLRRMTQAGSPQWKAVKYALCLPLVLSLVLFFSVNYLQALPLPSSEITLGESIEEMEQTPVIQLAVPAAAQKITSLKLEPSNILSLKLDTVPVQNSIKINGSATGVKIVTNGESFSVGQNGMVSGNMGKPLLIVDGKNMGKVEDGPGGNQMSKLDPGNIRNITVLKGESATKIYGDEGKDGVLIVQTKDYKGGDVQEIELNNVNITNKINLDNSLNVTNQVETENVNNNQNVEIRVNSVNTVGGKVENINIDASQNPKGNVRFKSNVDGRPLIVKDGKVIGRLHKNESDQPLKDIDPSTIKSVNIIKGKAAIDKYGKDAEDGVIEVETKKQ